jgi:predicted metallopeptidase
LGHCPLTGLTGQRGFSYILYASLKNNKASSFDQILNEMLKLGQTYIIDPLCKLFNNISSTGKFPVVWAKGIIVPIFKSGEKCIFI